MSNFRDMIIKNVIKDMKGNLRTSYQTSGGGISAEHKARGNMIINNALRGLKVSEDKLRMVRSYMAGLINPADTDDSNVAYLKKYYKLFLAPTRIAEKRYGDYGMAEYNARRKEITGKHCKQFRGDDALYTACLANTTSNKIGEAVEDYYDDHRDKYSVNKTFYDNLAAMSKNNTVFGKKGKKAIPRAPELNLEPRIPRRFNVVKRPIPAPPPVRVPKRFKVVPPKKPVAPYVAPEEFIYNPAEDPPAYVIPAAPIKGKLSDINKLNFLYMYHDNMLVSAIDRYEKVYDKYFDPSNANAVKSVLTVIRSTKNGKNILAKARTNNKFMEKLLTIREKAARLYAEKPLSFKEAKKMFKAEFNIKFLPGYVPHYKRMKILIREANKPTTRTRKLAIHDPAEYTEYRYPDEYDPAIGEETVLRKLEPAKPKTKKKKDEGFKQVIKVEQRKKFKPMENIYEPKGLKPLSSFLTPDVVREKNIAKAEKEFDDKVKSMFKSKPKRKLLPNVYDPKIPSVEEHIRSTLGKASKAKYESAVEQFRKKYGKDVDIENADDVHRFQKILQGVKPKTKQYRTKRRVDPFIDATYENIVKEFEKKYGVSFDIENPEHVRKLNKIAAMFK
jgi:hypothetical protein